MLELAPPPSSPESQPGSRLHASVALSRSCKTQPPDTRRILSNLPAGRSKRERRRNKRAAPRNRRLHESEEAGQHPSFFCTMSRIESFTPAELGDGQAALSREQTSEAAETSLRRSTASSDHSQVCGVRCRRAPPNIQRKVQYLVCVSAKKSLRLCSSLLSVPSHPEVCSRCGMCPTAVQPSGSLSVVPSRVIREIVRVLTSWDERGGAKGTTARNVGHERPADEVASKRTRKSAQEIQACWRKPRALAKWTRGSQAEAKRLPR